MTKRQSSIKFSAGGSFEAKADFVIGKASASGSFNVERDTSQDNMKKFFSEEQGEVILSEVYLKIFVKQFSRVS